MKKIVSHYLLIDCTAIAVSAGDTERQNAVLIRDLEAEFDADSIYFGVEVADLPDTPSDLESAISGEPISMDYEDLGTVEVDGRPISDYVGGEL